MTEYQYGIPYPVTLENGQSYPAKGDDAALVEILSIHSNHDRGFPPLYLVTPYTTEEGEVAENKVPVLQGVPGRWFANGECRFLCDAGDNDEARIILWVRTVTPSAETEAEPPKPPARRSRRAAAQEAEESPADAESSENA